MPSNELATRRVLPDEIESQTEALKPPAQSRAQVLLLAFCVSLSTAIALGFGRFGYSLVLPAMRDDLGWSYKQAGGLNTGNALGYLLGATCAAAILKRTSLRFGVLGGLALSCFALWLTGITHNFSALVFCRALVGFSGALTFIAAASLGLRLGRDAEENALVSGVIIAGPGIGVIAGGLSMPFIVGEHSELWPHAWQLTGAIGVLVLAIVAFATRDLQSKESVPEEDSTKGENEQSASLRPLLPILVAYFLFGVSYIAYMTFLIAYVRGLSGGASAVAPVWATLGVSMLASSVTWKKALSTDRGGRVLTFMGLGGAISAAIPLWNHSFAALLLSSAGFGLCSMPIFAAVSVAIRYHLPRRDWNRAVAFATIIFAVGQSLGPIGSGALSDHFGLSASLIWTAVIMLLAGFVALSQKKATNR